MKIQLCAALASLGLVAIAINAAPAVQAAPPPAAPVAKPAAFAMCSACHQTTKGAPSSIGPNLFGVGGRKAGKLPGYAYSEAMKKSGITWDKAKLTAYIQNPRTVVPGNKMAYAGQKDPAKAAQIVAYLMALK